MRPLNVCQIAAELTPFAKTGGLGDVVAGLSRYLGHEGHDVRIFLPFYGQLTRRPERFTPVEYLQHVPMWMGSHYFPISVLTCKLPDSDVDVYFVSCPPLFDQDGIYQGDWARRSALRRPDASRLRVLPAHGLGAGHPPLPRLAHRPRADLPARRCTTGIASSIARARC